MTHAQTEEQPTGKLVLVPDDLWVGETAEAIGFHLELPDTEVTIEYSEHFVPEGQDCDSAAAGTSTPAPSPARVMLTACSDGDAYVRLLETSTNLVIAEVQTTIAQPEDPPSDEEEDTTGEADHCEEANFGLPCPPDPPTGLGALVLGQRDIAVTWDRVSGASTYELDAGTLDGYSGSRRGKSYASLPCGSTHSFRVRAYGDGTALAAEWGAWSGTVTVTTEACPEITITGGKSPITEDESATFTLSANSPFSFSSLTINVSVSQQGDFLASFPSSVHLGRNRKSASLSLRIIDDSVCESDGSATVSIGTSTGYQGYTIGSPSSATVIIEDDDCTGPTPTPPGRVRNLSISAGDGQLGASWSAPSDNGGAAISRYNVQHKPGTASWPSGVGANNGTSLARTIAGLTNGISYDVRVRACNSAGCGNWSSKSGTPQGSAPVITAPGKMSAPTITSGDGSLAVSWAAPSTGSSPIARYKVRYKLTAASSWTNTNPVSSGTKATIGSLTNGSEYEVQVRACSGPSGNERCGNWSNSATGTPKPKLATPTNLDVAPMSLRRAKLTWDSVTNANGYVVRVKTSKRHRTISTSETEYVIRLDNIPASEGLAEQGYFELKVMAVDSTDIYEDSVFSETLTIIDSPIISINGDSSLPDGVHGPPLAKAEVKWDKPTGATGYTLKWRKLGIDTNDNAHTNSQWKLDDSSYPNGYAAEKSISNPNQKSFTVQAPDHPLDPYGVYAFQLNYTTTNGKVFSARDRFVWTSDRSAGGGQRITTIPLIKNLENRRFSYVFCDDTFPESNNPTWGEFTEHAIKQWMFATDHLITIDPIEQGGCADYSMFIDAVRPEVLAYVAEYPEVAEIPTSGQIEIFVENFAKRLDASGYESTRNSDKLKSEVLAVDDVDEPLIAVGLFDEVSRKVGHGICHPDAGGCAIPSIRKTSEGNSILTTDILLWRSTFKDLRTGQYINPELPKGYDGLRQQRDDVMFEACSGIDGAVQRLVYGRLIHETGHALGIGGAMDAVGQDNAHPLIVDSSMSYSRDMDYACAPQPLDIMAMYALYQTE